MPKGWRPEGPAAGDPTKFSKLLKNIENYIQKTYRSPDNMVKMLQHMKKVTLSYPTKPKKQDPQCCDKDGNPDEIQDGCVCMERGLQVYEVQDRHIQG
jgi:hypothetical protein